MAGENENVRYRALLEDEQAQLIERLRELGLDSSARAYDPNFADSSQVTAERGEVEALAGALAEALSEVRRALGKIDGDGYGRCERCKEPIDGARLEAMPATRFCIACAGRPARHGAR